MGWVVPAVQAGTAIYGAIRGHQASKPGSAEQGAASGVNLYSGLLGSQGRQFGQIGTGAMGQASDYWSTLLGGNRAAMGLATAGPRAAIASQARGTLGRIGHGFQRGRSKELAENEVMRDAFSQQAQLTAGVQPAAAGALQQIGGEAGRLGLAGLGGAGGLQGGLLNTAFGQRQYGNQYSDQALGAMGNVLFNILKQRAGTKKPPIESRRAPGSEIPTPMPNPTYSSIR